MSKINLDRVRNVFKESEQADDLRSKGASDQSLLRARRIASDQAKAAFVSDESLYSGNDATIDPYDTTTKASRASKKDLLTLSGSNYRTSLLEQLVKNQNNKEFNSSVLTFQDKTLTYLDSIETLLKNQFAPDSKNQDSFYNQNKELGREISELAKALAELSPGKAVGAMKKGLLSQFGLDQMAGMADLAFSQIKEAIKSGDIGSMIKQQIQESMINALPKNTSDKIRRFKDDPSQFFQDMINTLALDRNATVAQIFKPHSRGFKPSEQKERFDAKALAKFDNKFYTAVTKIMPDQLIKMNVYLEKLATGQVSNIQSFDWDKGDYSNLLDEVKNFISTATTNQRATEDLYKGLTDELQNIIENGTDKTGLLSRKTKRNSWGGLDYDSDGTIAFSDKDEFKKLLSAIINSRGSFNELRGNSQNLEQYLKAHDLGYKTVNGKTVKKSDAELAMMRNSLFTLQTMLNSMDPDKATKFQEQLLNAKIGISKQGSLDTHGWNKDVMLSMVDTAQGAADPNLLRGLFGAGGYFGGGGSGPSGGSGGGSSPKLYKNYKGQKVPWNQLSEAERLSITNAYIKDNKFGEKLSHDIIFKHTSDVNKSETAEVKRVRVAFEHGILTNAEYTDFLNGNRDYNSLKDKLDSYDKAVEFFNKMDTIGVTAAQMRTNNSTMSIRDFENMGFMSSPEQLARYIKDGKLDIDRLSKINPMYSQSFADNLDRISRDKQTAAEFNTYDPAGSVSSIFNAIFGDPRIAKKAGIAAGTAAGLGINKLLKMSGIVDSPKLGVLLGGVGAALMMTERAQNAVKNIFGPDGDVKNESGFSNKEIFMAKLMTRWLPSIGAGAKVAQATSSFFAKGGPLMAVMGIPAAMVTGLTASWLAPKFVSWAQKKVFSKEARDSGGLLGKAGEFIRNLNIPFVNKYIIGSNAEQSEAEIQIQALSREMTKISREISECDAIMKKEKPGSEEYNQASSRMAVLQKEFGLYEKAIASLKSIKNSNYEPEQEKAKILIILQELESKLEAESVKNLNISREQARTDAEFSTGAAANAKFGGTKERASAAYERFINDGGDPNSETAQRLKTMKGTGSLDSTFSDYSEANTSASISQYEIMNKLKQDETFSTYEINELVSSMNGKTKDEKLQLLEEFVNKNSNRTYAPLLRDYIRSKMEQDDSRSQLFNTVYGVQKALHPEMSEYDLQILTNNEVAGILQRGRTKAAASYAVDKNVNLVWDEVKSRFHDTFREQGDSVSKEGTKSINALYDEITNNVSTGGTGTEGDNKIFKMSELSDHKFKNGSSLSEAGCSIVAFNNALYYLGIPQVEINTLVDVANKYLTSTGGVTSEFFLEMCQRLNITGKIYNSQDNRFSVDSLRQLAPDKSRSLIVLLRNTNNDGAHFITIKSVGSQSCVVNDPEVNGTVDMSISTIIARAIEFIIISKTPSINSKLTESSESKSFGQKFKEWFKSTKVGKAVETFRSAVSAAKTGLNKVKEFIQNPESIKDKLGGFFSRGTSSTSDKPDKVESILQQILDKLSGIYDKPIPVSIWSDATLALQSTDDAASQVLADAMASDAKNISEATNIKSIKALRRKKEIQKERSEAQAVQEAIINGENLRAGTSTGVGGRGSGPVDPNNTVVNEEKKEGFLSKIFGGTLGKVLPAAAGAGLSFLPNFAAYKLAKPYIKGTIDQGFSLVADPTENVIGEDGTVKEGGRYRDFSGFARNVWNLKSLGKGVLGMNKLMSKGWGALANKTAAGTAKLTTKIAQWGNRGGKVAKTVAKHSSRIAKVAGTGVEFFAKGGKAVNDLFCNGLTERLMNLLDKISSAKNWPFVGKVVQFIESKISTLINWLKGKGAKLLQIVFRKAAKPASTARKIPFIGVGVSVLQALAAIYTGYRNAHKVLRIPKEDITTSDKLISASAKFLWDAIPMLISALISTFTGGVGGIAADAVIAIFQMAYGFDNFLIHVFKIDDAYRKERAQGKTKAEEDNEKQGEKELEEAVKQGESDEQSEQSKLEAEAKKTQDKINSQIRQENQNANNMPGVDVTAEADHLKEVAALHDAYKHKENTFFGWLERRGDKGAREQERMRMVYGADYDKKRREQIMNSPSVKAAMEAWKANPGQFFHPMGSLDTRITSVFGPRNVQGGSKNHRGIDFSSGGQSGKPVYAYKAGKVITSDKNYGLIEIQHNDGTISRYMHLSDRFPEVGKDVAMGEVIGTSGGTGKNGASAYIPHLHFEIRDAAGNNLDPFLQMSLDPKTINVAPAWKNQENISYFERYPWLKEKDAQADNKIKQAEKADSSNSGRTPTISDKPAGGPSDYDPMYEVNNKRNQFRGVQSKADKTADSVKNFFNVGGSSKDDLIVQLLQQQNQLMKQNMQLMQTLVGLVGEIKSSSENSNNDMLGALSMARF